MHRKAKELIRSFRESARANNATELLNRFDNELVIKAFEKVVDDPRQKPFVERLVPKVTVTVLKYAPLVKAGMGLSFWPFSSEPSDHDLGLKVVTAYATEALKYPEFKFSSVDEFITDATSKISDYLETVGSLVKANVASISQDDAVNSVIALADKSRGQASLSQIVMAAGGHGDTINYWQAVPEVAEETATDIVKETKEVLQDVGTGALATLKLTKYLPWVLGVGGLLYLFKSDLLKGLKK